MPPSQFRAPEIPEPGKDVGNIGHAAPNARVEAQFSQSDVSQAHQYFTPKADGGLPNLNIHSDGGASASVAHMAGGGEHAIGSIAQAGSHAALGAVIPPGGEPVSPLIQMIMKMPGLTGTLSSFFEFIGALFHGNIMDALNPALWAEHAIDAVNSMASNAQDFVCSLDIVHSATPTLSFDGMGFHPAGSLDGMNIHADSVSASSTDAANVGAPDSNVTMEQAIFEKTGGYKITEHTQDSILGNWQHPQEIALNGDANVYRPSMGGYYQAPAASAPTAPTTTTGVPNVHASAHAPAAHHAQAAHHDGGHSPSAHSDGGHASGAHTEGGHHAHHLSHVKIHEVSMDHTQVAQASDATAGGGSYTVQQGDNLWNIAKHQLGDPSRWGEIYKANADVIGQNPDLIMPGTTIQMPDGSGTSIASAGGDASSYTVHPGDNLWSIAKHHLGSGHHWGQIYHANESVIGGNPEMIHPGQHLAMNGGGAAETSHVASAPVSDHTPIAANPVHMAHPSPSAQMTTVTSDAAVTGAAPSHIGGLQAETPQLAPLDGSTPASAGGAAASGVPSASAAPVAGTYQPANFSNSASVGSEHTLDSSTSVPANDGGQGVSEGQQFFRAKP